MLAAFGVDVAGLGIEPLAYQASYAPYVIVVWMVLGVIALGYFAATDRNRIAATRLVFDEDGTEPLAARRSRSPLAWKRETRPGTGS